MTTRLSSRPPVACSRSTGSRSSAWPQPAPRRPGAPKSCGRSSLLVDINLGAESGFKLVEHLHRDGSGAPVILISTHAEQDFADMIAASPAVGFLCKTALSPGAIRDLLGGRDDDDAAGGVRGLASC